jgi:NADH-quinone oxidoreductase subunit G
MTVTANPTSSAPAQPELVTATIDDVEVSVPKGTLIIRAAEQIGIAIPRFCDHPLLAPAGACRQCLVEVATSGPDGTLRAMPKPQASCTLEITPGMVVRTQFTSPVAAKAQAGIIELLLVNHPLDCPVCDKGGECPLQNQAMSNGSATSRFQEKKRTFPKPIRISTQVLLDRERCVLCQRCTRFSKEIAGDPFIDLQNRGAQQQIGVFSPGVLGFSTAVRIEGATEGGAMADESGQPFASYFSGNTVQICPVGALTGAAYRFRARPFDLVSTTGVCEHCASGCGLRIDHRRGTVMRRLALEDPAVNEDWNCDKGRWAFPWQNAPDRLEHPLVRDEETGELRVASWPEALDVAARGLFAARNGEHPGGVGVLVGGRMTVEDAYAYAKFARVALHSNDVDFRARPHSVEEEAFLAHAVAGAGLGVTYRDLESAPAVLLAGLEPEEESPIVFLRLRKAVGKGLVVHAVAPYASRGLAKLDGRLIAAAPGTEAEVLDAIAAGDVTEVRRVAEGLRSPGAVVLVGERLAAVPGALSAAVRLANASGARLAWVPRRAGERGAVEVGALPSLLPGGRPVADPAARVDVATVWGVPTLSAVPGRDTAGILAAALSGRIGALVVGGVDPHDLPDPVQGLAALDAAFVVSLEVRASEVTRRADVVLPVAPPSEKAGTFVDWEGRWRSFQLALRSTAMSDLRALDALADVMDAPLGLRGVDRVRAELAELDAWEGDRAPAPTVRAGDPPQPQRGTAVLSTWHLLLDEGRMQDGEPYLAGTRHVPVVRLSLATAVEIGAIDGRPVTVSTTRGAVTLPLVVTPMPDRVVWLPTNSPRCAVRAALGADTGAVVTVTAGTAGTGVAATTRATTTSTTGGDLP